ncbi:MAG: DNA-3-methyladenine glycosylase 2 family protein, partial [Leptolyngbyaceae cyanobacterium SL_5_9]|nr:DNA-3-methyladenine glycosylase 2 family protein [Leptolyngbyaceae cyanobacterium SL_5_9]
HLERDPQLRGRVAALPGLRVPGTWDRFELAVRAILGQQISVAAATKLAGRLVEAYGEPLNLGTSIETSLRFMFPKPEVLAIADLTPLGLTRARAKAISSLAAAVAEGQLHNFSSLESAVQTLCKLPGVGEWTAHYIAMRALREPDAFPATDLGLRRSLSPNNPLTKAQLLEMAQSWRPWRAYAAMYLWLSEGLADDLALLAEGIALEP